MKKNILNFEEAISLFYGGAHGFLFQSQRGDTFTNTLDNNSRLVIQPIKAKEGDGE